jgi:hypothetical protein
MAALLLCIDGLREYSGAFQLLVIIASINELVNER